MTRNAFRTSISVLYLKKHYPLGCVCTSIAINRCGCAQNVGYIQCLVLGSLVTSTLEVSNYQPLDDNRETNTSKARMGGGIVPEQMNMYLKFRICIRSVCTYGSFSQK